MTIPGTLSPQARPAALRLALLGTPSISDERGDVSIPRRQPRALLYRLAASGEPLAREHLAFLLWPDVSTSTARRSLVVALNQLRSALPPGVIQTVGDTLAIDWQRVWCDARAFGRLPPAGDGVADLAHLQHTVALYRGPFVDGFVLPDSSEFDEWLTGERAAWERRYLQALAALAEHATSQHEYRIAIDAATRYLLTDPFAEALHRRLIALYAATGDRAEALRQFERCSALLERELGVEPAPETVAAYTAVRDGRGLLPPEPSRAERPTAPAPTLPAPPAPLIGRAAEAAALAELLEREMVRLLTIAGSGGSGKTCLALHVAAANAATFRDGVVFVALAPLRDPQQVLPAIAKACGVREGVDAGISLHEYFRHKRALLVLDNFEHLAPAAPELARLLSFAPQLRVLVTSRAALNLAGEHVFALPPLPLPPLDPLPPLEELAGQPALALLLERARAADPRFALTAENAAALAAICVRLDGLPLAIELAAARLRLLAPQMLLKRLDQRLALLTVGPRDLPERQQTLRATLDWSYRLLDVAEQLLFERLAVFAGSWSVEAAEQVCIAAGELSISVLDGIQALADRHLLQRSTGEGGEIRFRMLETIHEYAQERLLAGRTAGLTERAHAWYMCELAERAAQHMRGAKQRVWLERLDDEYANMLAAIGWADRAGEGELALRLTAALREFWHMRGLFGAGRRLLERALERADGPSASRSAALVAVTHLVFIQGDYPAARGYGQAAAESLRRAGDHVQLARILVLIASSAAFSGDFEAASAAQAEGEALAKRSGDREALMMIAYSGARDAIHRGDAVAANEAYGRSLVLARELDNNWWVANLQFELGPLALALGDIDTARDRITESVALASAMGDRYAAALAINNLGEAARLQGEYREAATYYAESLRRFEDLGNLSETPRVLHNLGYVALWEGDAERAAQLFESSLERFRAQRSERGMAEAAAGLAALAALQGRWQRAAGLWGCAEALLEAAGAAPWPADLPELRRYQNLARAAIPEPEFDAARLAGRGLSLDQALRQ